MSEKTFYIGSVGPGIYDDEDVIEEDDGTTKQMVAFQTDGHIRSTAPATSPDDLVRHEDYLNGLAALQSQVDSLVQQVAELASTQAIEVTAAELQNGIYSLAVTGDGTTDLIYSVFDITAGIQVFPEITVDRNGLTFTYHFNLGDLDGGSNKIWRITYLFSS